MCRGHPMFSFWRRLPVHVFVFSALRPGQVLSKKVSAISKRQSLWPMLDVSSLEAGWTPLFFLGGLQGHGSFWDARGPKCVKMSWRYCDSERKQRNKEYSSISGSSGVPILSRSCVEVLSSCIETVSKAFICARFGMPGSFCLKSAERAGRVLRGPRRAFERLSRCSDQSL